MKQMAYARRIFGAKGLTKKEIALDCGYSPNVANSISSHIENKPGFNNAMALLAVDSNNLALSAMHEFKARGFADFTNKELVGALNAIGNAWSKFNAVPKEKDSNPRGNKLKTVIMQQIENQTVITPSDNPTPPTVPAPTPQPATEAPHIVSSVVEPEDNIVIGEFEEIDNELDF